MLARIIEITTDNRHLYVERGFMCISAHGEEQARIALDDIGAVISCAHGLTFSNNLLVQLAARNTPFIACGSNFVPVACLWSLEGNYNQSSRMDAQIEATKPKSKQLWKQIVQVKITQQAAVLEAVGANPAPVKALVRFVRSGDPENIEAQAARRYWQALFGTDFRRDQTAGGINALLNYGYMIIRSCVARAIMGAGLHPSLGIHHSNAGNPMRLVDDLMEPYRPFVDFAAWHLKQRKQEEVTAETKRELVAVLDKEIATEKGMTTLRNNIQDAATGLAFIFMDKQKSLELPSPQPPLWLETS